MFIWTFRRPNQSIIKSIKEDSSIILVLICIFTLFIHIMVISFSYELNHAINDVLAMPPDKIYHVGMKLRETYAASRVVDRMQEIFKIS